MQIALERNVPHLALQGVSTEFVLIETYRKGNVPHVARVAQRFSDVCTL